MVTRGATPGELLEAAMHSPEGLENPYPFLEHLVADGESHVADDGHSYVYSYAASAATLRSPAFFKGGEHISSTSTSFTAEQIEVLRRERPSDPGMLTSIDDPDHARLRRLVSVFFTPKGVDRLRRTTEEVFDRVVEGFERHQPVDLVSTLFTELPSEVVGSLIGLPLSERASFAALAAVSSRGRDPDNTFDDHLDAVRAQRAMHAIIEAMIAEERGDPRDTMVGGLIRMEAEGETISDDEVVSLTTMMHSAGFGTTRRLLGNGLVALLRHPDQARSLRDDPSIARQATDEVLRYDGSVMTVAYLAADGAHVNGTALEPGSLCTIILGAANHDPRVAEAPAIFDVTRQRGTTPLSFGHGGHFCLGAALARMETDVVLGSLLRRFPNMELAEEPQRVPSFRSRSFREVSVILEPRGAA